jgi:hypothetical protein
MKNLNGISEELVLSAVASGVLVAPVLGLWPLVGVLAAVGTSIYIAGMFRSRR